MTDIRECETKGLIDHAPHYNSVFEYLVRPELTPLLTTLVHESGGTDCRNRSRASIRVRRDGFAFHRDEFLAHYHQRSNVEERVLFDEAEVWGSCPCEEFRCTGERSALESAVPQPQRSRPIDSRAWDRSEILDVIFIVEWERRSMSARRDIYRRADLTREEQARVRDVIRYLRLFFDGSWTTLSKQLRFDSTTLIHVINERRAVTPTMAFRVARLIRISFDGLLAGRFCPPKNIWPQLRSQRDPCSKEDLCSVTQGMKMAQECPQNTSFPCDKNV